jgi:glycosyltransferase involved in cell wall biosynthesis
MDRLRIVTWHIHGSYLYYLSQAPVELYVLSKPDRPPGYLGRYGHFPWGANVHDMPVADLARQSFDAVLFQSRTHYEKDQYDIFTPAQQRLPKIYLEHDPPRDSPYAQRHWVDDPEALLVHVTHFNALMWDSGRTPVCVIPHGVMVPPDVRYTGELERGIVVINHLAKRGRRLGEDVYAHVRRHVPLDLVGMGTEESPGGLGEIQHDRLGAFASRYRFFFNPIRYTSLGLAVCEAMMLGMPVVALATAEMSTTVENGVSGYVHNDLAWLIERMTGLLADPREALRLGEGAGRVARERFAIERFARDWVAAFETAAGRPMARAQS